MRWIYLSPHLDDAVLSAGGLIYEQTQAGIPVEVWTLLAGPPPEGELSKFAQLMHYLWGFSSGEQAVRERRLEDEKAVSMLGAAAVHFDFLDAIYRRGPDGEWLYKEDVSGETHPADSALPEQIAEAVSLRLLPDDVLVAQFGIGGHVDHGLVRAAAELIGRPLWYDADLPYLFNHPEELDPNTAGMSEVVQPVSEAGLEAWHQAILAYASQLSTVFDDVAKIPTLLREYWQPHLGVCLYRMDNKEY
ncbi:MAG TPA: PIG-L family deacetylase [Anaerolineales bacterium]